MKNLIITIMAIISMTFNVYSYAHEMQNLDALKTTLVKYHDSGEYLKDEEKVANRAIQYLKTRAANGKKLAIVLDIDETSLSNYSDMLAMSFGGTFKEICDAEGKGTDTAIEPTLKLYRYAKANNIAVFFITGRTENYRRATVKNLTEVGYKDWDGLILKPENYHEQSAAPYKTHAREQIEKQGYEIILNMGDQFSDLSGGHADKTFKLPNPYYLIP